MAEPDRDFYGESFMLVQKMIEQGNVTPLKDLYRRFISDCENDGYKITELQDEVTIESCGEPVAAPYSSQFDYMGMWLKHFGLDTLSEYENRLK